MITLNQDLCGLLQLHRHRIPNRYGILAYKINMKCFLICHILKPSLFFLRSKKSSGCSRNNQGIIRKSRKAGPGCEDSRVSGWEDVSIPIFYIKGSATLPLLCTTLFKTILPFPWEHLERTRLRSYPIERWEGCEAEDWLSLWLPWSYIICVSSLCSWYEEISS